MNFGIINQELFLAFWLAFARWLGILFQLPLFDHFAVPGTLKVLITVIITWAFFSGIQGTLIAEINGVGVDNYWILTSYHLLTGLIIGFLVRSMLSLYIATGSILTQQIGFGSVSYFDPTQAQQIGPFERLIEWTLIIIILSSGALLPMLKGGLMSFETIQIGKMDKILQTPEYFIQFFKSIFTSAVLLASPLIFANLLMNLIFGIVARTIPQMNVLMVSFVVNIGIGLLLFLGIAEEFFQVSYDLYLNRLGDWFNFVTQN